MTDFRQLRPQNPDPQGSLPAAGIDHSKIDARLAMQLATEPFPINVFVRFKAEPDAAEVANLKSLGLNLRMTGTISAGELRQGCDLGKITAIDNVIVLNGSHKMKTF